MASEEIEDAEVNNRLSWITWIRDWQSETEPNPPFRYFCTCHGMGQSDAYVCPNWQ